MSGHGHPRAKRGRSYLVIFNPTISRNILFFSSHRVKHGRLTPSYSECPLLLEFSTSGKSDALRSKKGTRVNTACGKKGERGKRKQSLFIYRGHFALVASFFLHAMLKQVA